MENTSGFEYDDVEVNRVPNSFIRLKQTGDGETGEVYIPLSELPSVIENIKNEVPTDINDELEN